MAEITNILANEKISIEAVTQHEPENQKTIPIVMITNDVTGSSIKKAVNKIESLTTIKENIVSIRVLKLNE